MKYVAQLIVIVTLFVSLPTIVRAQVNATTTVTYPLSLFDNVVSVVFDIVDPISPFLSFTRSISDKFTLEYTGTFLKGAFHDSSTSKNALQIGSGVLSGGDVYVGTGIATPIAFSPNTIVGTDAFTIGGGYGSNAFGAQSLRQLSSGEWNSAFGGGAGSDLGQGAGNTFLGNGAGTAGNHHTPWQGNFNTFVGYASASNIGAGSSPLNNNTIIGSYAADSQVLQGGKYNILIGSHTNLPTDNGSYQLNIGNVIFGSDISGTDYSVSPGKIGIGTPTPTARFTVHENMGENNVSLLDISSSASGPSTILYSVDAKGHHVYKGATPTTTSCGAGAIVTGNDSRGRLKVGTGSGATCTIVFANTWGTVPVCQVTKETGPFRDYRVVPTVNGFTITASGNIGSDIFAYMCDGI